MKLKELTRISDNRGDIVDLIENEQIHAVTYITFKKGAVRANHIHKETIQWNYITEGEMLLMTREPGKKPKKFVLKKGDLAVTVPNEEHAFQGLTKSAMIVFTKGPRGGKEYESDTFRLETPLIKPKTATKPKVAAKPKKASARK